MRSHWVVGAAVVLTPAAALGRPGPTSPLYVRLDTGYAKVQGDRVLAHWPGAAFDLPFAVRETVRGMSVRPDTYGAEYTLGGALLGTGFPLCSGPYYVPLIPPGDGGTDAMHNYACVVYPGPVFGLWRFDRDWEACEMLIPDIYGGVTCDLTDGTFWMALQLSKPTRAQLRHYGAGGELLATFLLNSGTFRYVDAAIALDHADGTLWVVLRDYSNFLAEFRQYSKTGQLLSTQTYEDLPLSNGVDEMNIVCGMEVQFPSCRVDWNGDGAVNVQDFLAYLSAYAAGAPEADLDESGGVGVADFLLFLSSYAAGC
jgi:hypothetical protein